MTETASPQVWRRVVIDFLANDDLGDPVATMSVVDSGAGTIGSDGRFGCWIFAAGSCTLTYTLTNVHGSSTTTATAITV